MCMPTSSLPNNTVAAVVNALAVTPCYVFPMSVMYIIFFYTCTGN